MPDEIEQLNPGEEVVSRFRPLWRSFWVFFFGMILCGVGPFVSPQPPLSPSLGITAAAVFALIIARRWSNVYTLTNQRVMVRGGLFARDTQYINLASIRDVEAHQGLTSGLVGTGHLLVRTLRPDLDSILIYGQPAHMALKAKIESLSAEARAAAPPEDEDDRMENGED